jgi:signal transduction histidine kinase
MSVSLSVDSETRAQMGQFDRAAARQRVSARGGVRLAALRVPLFVKIVGANLLVVATLVALWLFSASIGGVAAAALTALVLVVHLSLVAVALRPVRDLEGVASRVWQGDLGARVDPSAVADHETVRIGAMFNILLDSLASERARMRALASEVIAVGDRERAVLAHELHDSTAQRLAALYLHLSVVARDGEAEPFSARLAEARDMAQALTEEVRMLAQTVHPRILDDLGLPAALQKLARDVTGGTGIDVDIDAPREADALPRTVASVLYRVTQESVRNAVTHGSPTKVNIVLRVAGPAASVEVRDNGRGFELEGAWRHPSGTGLMAMRERVLLVDGQFDVQSTPGSGTVVVASVPTDGNVDEARMETANGD